MSNKKTSFKELGSLLGEKLDKVTEKVSDSIENFDKESFKNGTEALGKKVVSATANAGNEAYKSVQKKYDEAVGEDKYCICCGKKLGIIGEKRKLADGTLCKNCVQKYTRVINEEKLSLPTMTFGELNAHYEVFEENRKIREGKEKKKQLIICAGILAFCFIGLFALSGNSKEDNPADKPTAAVSEKTEDKTAEASVESTTETSVTEVKSEDEKSTEITEQVTVTQTPEKQPVSATEIKTEEEKPTESTEQVTVTQAPEQNSAEKKTDSVSYSTNDLQTAKQGNTGVFAYKKSGRNYDQYCIVDFDEGYVYLYSEGNSNEICERLKIESGDLNDVLMITYHDGGDTWQNGLHFRFKNHPDKLVLEDQNHDEWTYETANLDKALEIMAGKTIVDY